MEIIQYIILNNFKPNVKASRQNTSTLNILAGILPGRNYLFLGVLKDTRHC